MQYLLHAELQLIILSQLFRANNFKMSPLHRQNETWPQFKQVPLIIMFNLQVCTHCYAISNYNVIVLDSKIIDYAFFIKLFV